MSTALTDDEPLVVLDTAAEVAALPSFDPADDDASLHASVVRYYQACLPRSANAIRFLDANGIAKAAVVRRFGLGMSDRSLGVKLPNNQLAAGRAIRQRLTAIGVLHETGHELLRGSLVVPIAATATTPAMLYGTKVNAGRLRPGTPNHLFTRPAPPWWSPSALAADADDPALPLVITDTIINALVCWAAGLRRVVVRLDGSLAHLAAAITAAAPPSVLLALPRTPLGATAVNDWQKALAGSSLAVHSLRCPLGRDIGSIAGVDGLDAVRTLARIAEPVSEPRTLVRTALPAPVAAVAAPVTAPAEAAPGILPIRRVGDDLHLDCGDRHYRVRGLARNQHADVLRVMLRVERGTAAHVDALDLYQARNRAAFLAAGATELGCPEEALARDLGSVLLALERERDREAQAAATSRPSSGVIAPTLSATAAADARRLLEAPDLTDRVLADFRACGVVGEDANLLIGYLATISRKLHDPLAIVIQSSSAAGKSSLMDAILGFVPEEDLVEFSAMTGQSLFYMSETGLQHRVLAIAEDAGMERAAYAVKVLQSAGELRIASTGKDGQTGRLTTQVYTVRGPVAVFLTTTRIDLDEELLNRAVVLTIDEGRAQTRAVQVAQRQRRTGAGWLAHRSRAAIRTRQRDMQRLLEPLPVINPYAEALTFPDTSTRCRRDHGKYLGLIDAITLLHQRQRQRVTMRIEGQEVTCVVADRADIAMATKLAHQVLGRSLDDLPPQTRRLLHLIGEHVATTATTQGLDRRDVRFTRRDILAATGWGFTQLKLHLRRLVDQEYLYPHRGGTSEPVAFELVALDLPPDGNHVLPGMPTPEQIAALPATTEVGGVMAGPGRAEDGRETAPGAGLHRAEQTAETVAATPGPSPGGSAGTQGASASAIVVAGDAPCRA